MKKIVTTAAVSTALVFGFAAGAMAENTPVTAKGMSKLTIDGSLRMRGYTQRDNTKKDNSPSNAYDGRVRLGVKAQVSDSVTGRIRLETNQNHGDTYTWGGASDPTDGLHNGGSKQETDKTGMTLLEAWIDYSPGNWGLKVGHQPIALGNKLFYDHTTSGDDAIQVYGTTDQLQWALYTIKLAEQSKSDNSDDLDAYMALAKYKVSDTLKLGVNYTYVKGPSKDDDDVALYTFIPSGGVLTYTSKTLDTLKGMELSNLGLTADGKSGAIDWMIDGEFQFGDYSDNGTTTKDAEGWAVQAAANYDLGGAKVGLLYGYGSGQKTTDTDHKAFFNLLADTGYQSYLVGYRFKTPGQSYKDSGLTNLSIYQVNASSSTTCPLTGLPLSLKGRVNYIMLNEDIATATPTNKTEDKIGTEINLFATWKLTSALAYKVEAAYLFAGDAYNTTANNSDPDDLYFLRNGLELKF